MADELTDTSTDYVPPVEVWWHIAYADRPGLFVYNRVEAIRIAEETGAQFVQRRGTPGELVWTYADTSAPPAEEVTGGD